MAASQGSPAFENAVATAGVPVVVKAEDNEMAVEDEFLLGGPHRVVGGSESIGAVEVGIEGGLVGDDEVLAFGSRAFQHGVGSEHRGGTPTCSWMREMIWAAVSGWGDCAWDRVTVNGIRSSNRRLMPSHSG